MRLRSTGHRNLAIALAAASFLAPSGSGSAAEPKPVPLMQALPLPRGEASFQRAGIELTRYHHTPGAARPFLYPLIGPAGRSLTRMGHPRDPESHSHHNSVWLSHHNVGGVSFWEDKRGGTIVHQRVLRFEDGEEESLIETENAWITPQGKTVLHELRRHRVRTLESGEWMLLIETQLEARTVPVILGETPFGIIGIRMAKTIGVHDGGGTIRNSEGGIDEAGCFRKPARWVDYSGPITMTAIEGITLMDHPANLHHPVAFHVRDDGWMGAALTFAGAHTIQPAAPLQLRYGLYIHSGKAVPEKIEERWKAFAAVPFEPFKVKK